MHRWIQSQSPAMVLSVVALFVSLGGVGYAAATIGSAQIKDGSVASKDIKNRTIATKDLNRKTAASLRGRRGDTGPPGPTGAAGPTGAVGPQGLPGISGLERVLGFSLPFDSTSPKTATVSCPAGKQVVGTGYNLNAGGNTVEQHLQATYVLPTPDNSGVRVGATEDAAGTTGNWNIVAVAQCAEVAP